MQLSISCGKPSSTTGVSRATPSVPGYAKLAHALKDTPDYRALPAKVAQWVVRQVCGDWDTFWLCRDKSETLGKEKSWKLVSIAQWVRGACGG